MRINVNLEILKTSISLVISTKMTGLTGLQGVMVELIL